MYEALSSYFATQGSSFEDAVLKKRAETQHLYVSGQHLNNIFFSVSRWAHPIVYSALSPWIGKTITFGVEDAGTTIVCDLKPNLTIDGQIRVYLFGHNSDV